jgi:hypothetical protein
MGRHHLCFYLDDILIGILVQDYLPSGLISIYFMYKPVFSPLHLGKISILLETENLRQRQLNFPEHTYYYLMTYISSCTKLQYKIDYKPCEIYCRETKKWVLVDQDVRKNLFGDNETVRLAPKEEPIDYSDEFEDDYAGYLAQCVSLSKDITQSEGSPQIKEMNTLDFEKVSYERMHFEFGKSSEHYMSWWSRSVISRAAIIKGLGLNLMGKAFFDISSLMLKADDGDDPEEIKKKKLEAEEAAI